MKSSVRRSKMKNVESFEVTEYGQDHRLPDETYSAIVEIVRDQVHEHPEANVRVSFTGNLMKLTYHCYEMLLPTRMREVEALAKSSLDATVKNLKKEFKKRTKNVLDVKEKKDMANYSVQKTSLNERYMCSFWRFYELGEED